MRYDFICHDCNEAFEVVMPMREYDNNQHCPSCGKKAGRLFDNPAHLNVGKGSRIYNGEVCNTLPGEPFVPKNKHDFRERCKKHGLTPAGL